jgi:Mrp family chromosome partitioning ATPase
MPSNPSELLNGKRFSRVMAAVVAAYDKVVIDSPPVAPVTDARVLAASADVTLLVLRADKSTDRQGALAVDSLRSVGAVMLGVVMNDMPRRKDAYGYYSGYYYYGRDARGNRATVVATDVTADFDSMPDITLDLPSPADLRQLAPVNGAAHKEE